jgi:hypothetical protein
VTIAFVLLLSVCDKLQKLDTENMECLIINYPIFYSPVYVGSTGELSCKKHYLDVCSGEELRTLRRTLTLQFYRCTTGRNAQSEAAGKHKNPTDLSAYFCLGSQVDFIPNFDLRI